MLSYFGLVPAALMGVNIRALLHRCQVAEQMCAHYDSSESNSGLWEGAALGELALRGRDKLTFVVSHPIESFGLWAEQLVAESTGKLGRGIVPVADEPLAESADAYGNDRVFAYIRLEKGADAAQDKAVDALAQAGHPVVRISLGDIYNLGQEMFRWEIATAVAGSVIGINAFNQPDVEASKIATRQLSSGLPSFPASAAGG